MRSEAMERRLHEWAAWFNAGGCRADGGWPVKNILHPSWMPPTGAAVPSLPGGGRTDVRERATHAAIGGLSDKAIATVVVHYCKRWSLEDQAQQLGCKADSIAMRIDRIHAQLHEVLASDGISAGVL